MSREYASRYSLTRHIWPPHSTRMEAEQPQSSRKAFRLCGESVH